LKEKQRIIKLDASFSQAKEELQELERRKTLTDEEVSKWASARARAWLWERALQNGGFVSSEDLKLAFMKSIFWDSRDIYELERKQDLPWFKRIFTGRWR